MQSQIQQSQVAAERFLQLQQQAKQDELNMMSLYTSGENLEKQHVLEQLQSQAYQRQQQLLSLCFERIYEAADLSQDGGRVSLSEDDKIIKQQKQYISQLEAELRKSVEEQNFIPRDRQSTTKMTNVLIQTDDNGEQLCTFEEESYKQQIQELQRINNSLKEQNAKLKVKQQKINKQEPNQEYLQFKQQAEAEIVSYISQLKQFQQRNKELQGKIDDHNNHQLNPLTESRVQLELSYESQSVQIQKLLQEVQQKNQQILELGMKNAKLNQQLNTTKNDMIMSQNNEQSLISKLQLSNQKQQEINKFLSQKQDSELPTASDLNSIINCLKIPNDLIIRQINRVKSVMLRQQFKQILPLHIVPSETCELSIFRYLQNNLEKFEMQLERQGEFEPPLFSCDSKSVSSGDALNFIIFSVIFRGEIEEVLK
ncbi:hypothetical protein SS50377_27986 [Spironucleus salmonicida]|uniref:Uncharacterized protein n=1 Tax=Spironucleus salmonicida TaxID=348837 RepID=V6LE37_9EUKA|nr:hypothetical protein SS50377_27986 [Spironucleus salmonicida]|eukprot:EST42543.1 Hypothetical protein SS50377_17857 [Spironucleus salmonicida]